MLLDLPFAIPLGLGIFTVFGIILGSILWLWSLIHCIGNRNLSDTNRVIGIVLIVTLGFIGSILYLMLPRQMPRSY